MSSAKRILSMMPLLSLVRDLRSSESHIWMFSLPMILRQLGCGIIVVVVALGLSLCNLFSYKETILVGVPLQVFISYLLLRFSCTLHQNNENDAINTSFFTFHIFLVNS